MHTFFYGVEESNLCCPNLSKEAMFNISSGMHSLHLELERFQTPDAKMKFIVETQRDLEKRYSPVRGLHPYSYGVYLACGIAASYLQTRIIPPVQS